MAAALKGSRQSARVCDPARGCDLAAILVAGQNLFTYYHGPIVKDVRLSNIKFKENRYMIYLNKSWRVSQMFPCIWQPGSKRSNLLFILRCDTSYFHPCNFLQAHIHMHIYLCIFVSCVSYM